MRFTFLSASFLIAVVAVSQTTAPKSDSQFVTVSAPIFALDHVRVIDGTGAAAREDQAVVVDHGKLVYVGPAGAAPLPAGAQRMDFRGYTVIPGLVGMHDHLYYTDSAAQQSASGQRNEPGFFVAEIPFSAPRLYLAAGVTTMRTTGSVEPYTDLKVKESIDAGRMPGPAIDASAPYLEGAPSHFAQMHELTGPEDAVRLVDYWSSLGMTSYKAYMNISREDLGAAIQQAHTHHAKLTGHLCSVTWPEAIALGIDDLEHGPVFTDTEFVAGKQADRCPKGGSSSWEQEEIAGARVQRLIQNLVSHRVAVTSTLPVFEAMAPGRPVLKQRVLDAMSPEAAQSYLTMRAKISANSPVPALLRKEMDFEVAFVKAGGLLLAGPDPTGNGGVLPGFGDQREIELLVEAGFSPEQAIHIATENGAIYLGRERQIGTLATGKQADMVLIDGNPVKQIGDIENVRAVFRDGVGYDSEKLIQSVRGQVGIR